MSIIPILRDSSPGKIYIDRSSNSNPYPVIKVDGDEIDFLNGASTISNYEEFFEKDFSKILNFNSFRLIVSNFRSNQVSFKTSSRILFIPTRYFTLLRIEDSNSKKDKLNNKTISGSNLLLIKNKAEELLYGNKIETTSDRKKSFLNPETGSLYTAVSTKEESTPRHILTYEDIKSNLNTILESWKNLRNTLQNQNCLQIPMDITMGSVAPLFKNTNFEKGYLTAYIEYLYREVGEEEVYKKSISITYKGSSASLIEDGVQLVWSLPDTPEALIKIVWDKSLIHSARMLSINLIKYK